MSPIKVNADEFWKNGFSLIKGVFSPEEIETFRKQIFGLSASHPELIRKFYDQSLPLGDLLCWRPLRGVLFDDRVLKIARTLLGDDPVYFGDSSFQFGSWTDPRKFHYPGWHKDNRGSDREALGEDWDGRYDIIRMGIYLQDHARFSGGLGIRIGSHNHPDVRSGRPIVVNSQVGDLAVWNLRTTHAGHMVKIRFAGKLSFDGRWFQYVPSFLRAPQQKERAGIFMTFAKRGSHLDRYIEYLKTREDLLEHYRRMSFDSEVTAAAQKKGLQLLPWLPEHKPSYFHAAHEEKTKEIR